MDKHWFPLEKLAAADKRVQLGDFMFMGTENCANTPIFLYKHVSTRRYINLDLDGNFYVYAYKLDPPVYIRTLDTEGVIVPAVGLNG